MRLPAGQNRSACTVMPLRMTTRSPPGCFVDRPRLEWGEQGCGHVGVDQHHNCPVTLEGMPRP
jgi:hypothetical protein